MHEGIGQPDALAEAFGEFPDHAPMHLSQIKLRNHILNPFAAGGFVQPLESGAKFQILPHPHVFMQRIVFGHEPHTSAYGFRVRGYIMAGHSCRAFGGG